jgi:hypothetical protein
LCYIAHRAHGHDWPVLTIFRIGDYREVCEGGEIFFDGPSVVFQQAGAAHADNIGEAGLEALAITFDPAWLTADARAALPARTCWRPGGPLSAASRRLAEIWLSPDASEQDLQAATSRFVLAAARAACLSHIPGLDRRDAHAMTWRASRGRIS